MGNAITNRHILNQSSGQKWHFFYHAKDGICFEKKLETGWDEYQILFKNSMNDFDVTVDHRDYIHLVCQDKTGSIIYLTYNNRQWQKYVILKSKSAKAYRKNFKMLLVNQWINLIYTIEYKEKTLLVHHVLDNRDVPPNVIDYINDTQRSFCAAVDNSSNMHIFYQSDAQSGRLGYKTYIWSKKTWSHFTSVQEQSTDIRSPYAIVDKQDNIHLTYLKKAADSYHIIYKRKPYRPSENLSWDKEITVHTRANKSSIPVMLATGENLWLLWHQNISVYSSFSQNNGTTWSSPTQFMAGRYGDIDLFGYISAVERDNAHTICNRCYGYGNNHNIVLYVLSNYLQQLDQEKAEHKPQYKAEGHEIEEFAKENISSFIPSSTAVKSYAQKASKEESKLSADIEVKKLQITVNMLKEELSQLKKKFLENNRITEIDEELTNYIDQKCNIIMKNLKQQNELLSDKIAQLEQKQTDLLNTKIDAVSGEMEPLKKNAAGAHAENLPPEAKNEEEAK